MRRREVLIAWAVLATPSASLAQQKLPVIGFLSSRSEAESEPHLRAFEAGLREAGYVGGQNVALEHRWASGHYERLSDLASELVSERVQVIAATGGNVSALAAKSATSTIPVVFIVGADPVALGLVASLHQPGSNATQDMYFSHRFPQLFYIFRLRLRTHELCRPTIAGHHNIASTDMRLAMCVLFAA